MQSSRTFRRASFHIYSVMNHDTGVELIRGKRRGRLGTISRERRKDRAELLDRRELAKTAGSSASRAIAAGHARRAAVALKLWSIERKSHTMALVVDQALGRRAEPVRGALAR